MKQLLITTLAIALLTISACNPTPPPDTPRYTADQVIAVAQAHSPCCGSIPQVIERAEKAGYPQWTVEYRGQGIWKIWKDCGIWGEEETWLFDEATGKMQ